MRWVNRRGALVLGIWLAMGLNGCGEEDSAVPRRAEAAQAKGSSVVFPPDKFFELKDYRGEKFDLRDYAGKVVVLNFWATWCPPCRYEIPHLIDLRKGFDKEKVAIIGVSLDRGEMNQIQPLLGKFVEQFEINYPILVDRKFELIRQFFKRDLSTLGVPMTFVIDQQGRIYKTHEGLPQDGSGRPNPGAVLGREIQALLDRS